LGLKKQAIIDYENLVCKQIGISAAITELFFIYIKNQKVKKAERLLKNYLRDTRINSWGSSFSPHHTSQISFQQLILFCNLLLQFKQYRNILKEIELHVKFLEEKFSFQCKSTKLKIISGIAFIYEDKQQSAEKCLSFLKKCKNSEKNRLVNGRFFLIMRVIKAYMDNNLSKKAINLLKLLEKCQRLSHKLTIWEVLGDIFQIDNNYKSSVKYYFKNLLITMSSSIMMKLSNIYMLHGDFHRAFKMIYSIQKYEKNIKKRKKWKLNFLQKRLIILYDQCQILFENEDFSSFLERSEYILAETFSYFIKPKNLFWFEIKTLDCVFLKHNNSQKKHLPFKDLCYLFNNSKILELMIQISQIWQLKMLHEDSLHILMNVETCLFGYKTSFSCERKRYNNILAELNYIKCENYNFLRQFDKAYESLINVFKLLGPRIPILRTFQLILINKKYCQKLMRFLERKSGENVRLLSAHLSFSKNTYTIVREYEKVFLVQTRYLRLFSNFKVVSNFLIYFKNNLL